jgi:predicted flap endonuclease-1-like 5' DNA nuclease
MPPAAAAAATAAALPQEPPETPAETSPPVPPAPTATGAAGAPPGELTKVPGITPVYALLLRQAGITDLTALAGSRPAQVVEVASPAGVTPIDLATAERWVETARLLTSPGA